MKYILTIKKKIHKQNRKHTHRQRIYIIMMIYEIIRFTTVKARIDGYQEARNDGDEEEE